VGTAHHYQTSHGKEAGFGPVAARPRRGHATTRLATDTRPLLGETMDIAFDGIIFVLMIGAQFLGVIAVYNARVRDDRGEFY
jgi:hypothetical protein